MTEEIKEEQVKPNQWSISPDFRNFLLTILASFFGCLVALCLYNATIRPPVKPCPCPAKPPVYGAPYHHRGEFRPDRPYKHHKIKPDKQVPKAKTDKK